VRSRTSWLVGKTFERPENHLTQKGTRAFVCAPHGLQKTIWAINRNKVACFIWHMTGSSLEGWI